MKPYDGVTIRSGIATATALVETNRLLGLVMHRRISAEQQTYQADRGSPDGELFAVDLALLKSVHKLAGLRGFHVAGEAVQGQEVQAHFLPPKLAGKRCTVEATS